MKQLLSLFCFVLCLHSTFQSPGEIVKPSLKTSGEKQLVKALTAIVNREGNRKVQCRRIDLSPKDSPRA